MKVRNIVLWVLQVLLGFALLMAGVHKLTTPYSVLNEEMSWTLEFSPLMIVVISIVEIAGVLIMFLPFILKKDKKVSAIGALILAATMAGAVFTHISLGEPFVAPLVLMSMAIVIGALRWNESNNKISVEIT